MSVNDKEWKKNTHGRDEIFMKGWLDKQDLKRTGVT